VRRPESLHDPRKQNATRLARLDAVFRALSHPVRRHILLTLKIRGERMSAGDIASRYACKWPTVARHLAVLKRAKLVKVEREGRSIIYSLNKKALSEVVDEWLTHFDL